MVSGSNTSDLLIMKIKRNLYILLLAIFQFIFRLTPFNSLRISLLRLAGSEIGDDNFISNKVRFEFPWRLLIGNNNYISDNVYLDCRGGSIVIGNNNDISIEAIFFTLSHDINSPQFVVKRGDIYIGNRSWVCARAIILPNTIVSDGVVVASNSTLRSNTIKNSLYSGVPCKLIKKLPSKRSSKVRGSQSK
jgi:acetyltransferase-like isoleucine patch superfamily enzyme